MKKILFLFIVLVCYSVTAQKATIEAGPMVGYCEMKEAIIWLQTSEAANVKVGYYATDAPAKVYFSNTETTSKDSGFTYHIVLDKLEPGKKYNYSVYLNDKKQDISYETSFSSKKLWQWREDAPDFTVALGSCSYISEASLDRPGKPYGAGYGIFESINAKKPDIMIWGGDNIYLREADWDSKTGIYHRYSHTRKIKEVQPLLARTQNFAIWDDHDFGPNDGDRSFYNKRITQQAFKDFWANKSYGLDAKQEEGNFSTFNWGDVQFFLLDNRFFKSPNNRITGEKTLLGEQQLQWLIDALSYSPASFKVIVIGGQVLNSAAVFENYSNYADEKTRLLNEIAANKIKGVFFISGDRHFTELSKLPRKNTYPLYDWTVSPLTSGVATPSDTEKNMYRVPGSFIAQNNFGTITFSGNKENRQVQFTLFDVNGKEIWKQVILKKELE
ncbi:MAG TPA: alkaline phosphatase D family protein [Flavobacterium sp.]|jgi:alkaline phosphatase D